MGNKAPSSNRALKTGIIGAAISMICCFTPVLVLLFSIAGVAALTPYIDMVLLPVLAASIALIIYGMWRRQRHG